MRSDTFLIPEAIYNEIVGHAREGKPNEVCGILCGRGNQAQQLVRARNVAADPVRDYEVDPQTLLRQFDFEEEGDEMVGIYHSHPVSPAYPSASDAWSAQYPDCVYLICSLANAAHPEIRAFRLIPQEVSLDLSRLPAQLDVYETRPGRFAVYQRADAALPDTLQAELAPVPRPFYIVFESVSGTGKKSTPRVVSVLEEEIQIARS